MKAWGSPKNPPILLLHGKQDNAGSFDLLIPKLPEHYYYVCMDSPGHGKSSPIPQFIPLNMMFYVQALQFVIDYFKWTTIKIICHSMGADFANNYAFLYPEKIECIIALDYIAIWPVEPHTFEYHHKRHVEGLQRVYKKIKSNEPVPTYTYDEALKRLIKNRPTKICEQAAINMLDRAINWVGDDKVCLTTDPRLRHAYFQPISKWDIGNLIEESNFQFPYLILLASETSGDIFETREPMLHALKRNKKCRIYLLEGNHDLHNNKPALVAKYIKSFLDKHFINCSKI